MKSISQHLFKEVDEASDVSEIKIVKFPSSEITASALKALNSGKAIVVVLEQLDRLAIGKVADLFSSCTATYNQITWLGEQTFLLAPRSYQISSSKPNTQLSSRLSFNSKQANKCVRQALRVASAPPRGQHATALRLAQCSPLKSPQTWLEELGNYLLEMVLLPGGSFTMGSPETEAERSQDESPQHLVNIPSVSVSKYPIAQCQWQAVAALPQIERPLDPNPSHFQGALLPVEQVSWYDAVEFCARLSQKTGREYRLPSEAEWEYACRAGTTTPFCFGATLSPELANYDSRSAYGAGTCGQYRQQTTAVGYFGVENAFGLFDLHGNVWEWCCDRWHDNYRNAPSDGSAWLSGPEKQPRVIRGGSWYDMPRFCRSACRYGLQPSDRSNDVGFRVVCSQTIS